MEKGRQSKDARARTWEGMRHTIYLAIIVRVQFSLRVGRPGSGQRGLGWVAISGLGKPPA